MKADGGPDDDFVRVFPARLERGDYLQVATRAEGHALERWRVDRVERHGRRVRVRFGNGETRTLAAGVRVEVWRG